MYNFCSKLFGQSLNTPKRSTHKDLLRAVIFTKSVVQLLIPLKTPRHPDWDGLVDDFKCLMEANINRKKKIVHTQMDLEGYKLYKSLRLTWEGQLVMFGRSESPWAWSVSGAAPLAVTAPSASVSVSGARSSIPWARPVTAAEVERSLLALQDDYLGSRCTAHDEFYPFFLRP